jgi:hypothetical protein
VEGRPGEERRRPAVDAADAGRLEAGGEHRLGVLQRGLALGLGAGGEPHVPVVGGVGGDRLISHAEQHPVVTGVLTGEGQVRPAQRDEALPGVRLARRGLAHVPTEPREALVGGRPEQRLLVGEVQVHRRRGHADGGRHLTDGDVVDVPGLLEEVGGGIDELFP